ncbi:MAG TPA: glycosyl transferase family protein, partial [Pusillimonas sp.]|nr:glycosyl transferase family protein [Pusillimonas sp.]
MFGLSATFFLADYFRLLEMMAIAVAIVILISSVDDTFIDICYWVRRLYRRFSPRKKFPRLNEEDLRGRPEQPLAVMVPA